MNLTSNGIHFGGAKFTLKTFNNVVKLLINIENLEISFSFIRCRPSFISFYLSLFYHMIHSHTFRSFKTVHNHDVF